MKEKGRVTKYDTEKGFGFITAQDGEEYFVHFSGIVGDGFKMLEVGDEVEFYVVNGAKGEQAVEVEKIEN